jgi:hypothetical protein
MVEAADLPQASRNGRYVITNTSVVMLRSIHIAAPPEASGTANFQSVRNIKRDGMDLQCFQKGCQ